MSRSFCLTFFIIFLLTIGLSAFAQPAVEQPYSANFTVSKRLLSIESGLASHEVFCGLQDTNGFLWFGTRNGINRYDGKNCLLFTRQRNNLQDNKVVQLAKDDRNNLFIEYGSTGFQLSTNGKVDVMNMLTHEVKTLTEAYPKMPFKEEDVYWISNDGSKQINFLTTRPFRLWKYASDKGFQLRLEMNDWVTQDSLAFFDFRSTGQTCVFAQGKALIKLHNRATQYFVTDKTVTKFFQKDALRSLPVGITEHSNLLITYTTEKEKNAFTLGMISPEGSVHLPAHPGTASADSITGRYWYQITSASDGLSSMLYDATDALYAWSENHFLKIMGKQELRNFESLFLYQLFPDNLGNLWLCTSHGVLQFKIAKNRFQQYFTTAQQKVEPNSQARGIYADDSMVAANVWRQTFFQREKILKHVANDEIGYAMLKHNSSIYIGGYYLIKYDEKNNRLIKYPASLGTEIWALQAIDDSLILIGRINGFLLFNSKTEKFDSLCYFDKNRSQANFIYRILKDHSDSLWAIAENGLYNIVEEPIVSQEGKNRWGIRKVISPTIGRLSLLDACFDKNDVLWLATNGEGLWAWHRKTNTFHQFTIADGLPSDVLYRIEHDKAANLWISSDNGLIRFNTKTFAIKAYTTDDGLSDIEFNRISSFKAKDGQLYFGGLNGVNAFNPADFSADTASPNIPLKIIVYNQFTASQNKLVNKTSSLLKDSQIKLDPGDQFFTLEFQLLDFSSEESHRYAYKISGIDKDWNYISENSIRISGLPYGSYTLQIKAQNGEGAWSRSELSIPVEVIKPFYLQPWFLAILLLALIAAIYGVIKLRTRQLAHEKIRLEQTVNERTLQLKKSLQEQSELLAEKDVLMKEIHHRVKNNLQVISGLLELQSKGLTDEAARDALMEGRSRVKSIALIHQNLYQFENISSIEFKRFASDLFKQITSVFDQHGNVVLSIDVPEMYLDIDSAVPLGLILNELLSNSFKYAFNDRTDGEVKLRIQPVSAGKYSLLYEDNGPGLPENFDWNKVNTLGLQLISDLSRQIGGTVQYRYDNGASFRIDFTTRAYRKNMD